MKFQLPLASALSIACATVAFGADAGPKSLPGYAKNLARQHVGSNLFLFNASNQTYIPTEAAASWLDDDPTSGWPLLPGKQSYLLVLSEPETLTGFTFSARPANGTISVFAGDEPTAPGSASWKAVIRDAAFESLNNHKLDKSFTHLAKYLLIQTDVADPGPVYGLNVYGEKPATSYSFRKRDQVIDAHAIFGQYVNTGKEFNLAGLYSGARVSFSNAPGGFNTWQHLIDDNPETPSTLSSSADSSAVVTFGAPHSVSRIALFNDTGAKGRIDFYAVNGPVNSGAALSLEGLTPTVSIVIDGTNPRSTIEFPRVQASALALRWVPDTANETLSVRELAVFNGVNLDEYEVSLAPEAIAEYRPAGSGNPRGGSEFESTYRGPDGKESKEIIDPKKNPEPVALGPQRSPYLPGALGFPPSLTRRVLSPVSP